MPDDAFATDAPRFLCPDLAAGAGPEVICRLDRDQSRHAARVLRLSVGDAVQLIDGRGTLARAQLLSLAGAEATCRVLSVEETPASRPSLTLAVAIPKGSRAEDMVDQLSQLGVDRLIPLICSRSVVEPRDAKLERFRRRAEESAKQCRRLHIMVVDALSPLEQVLGEAADVRVLLDPSGGPLLEQAVADAESVLALIGPEGGFTMEESAAARQAGFVGCSVGPNILRIETAAAATAALMRALAGPVTRPWP